MPQRTDARATRLRSALRDVLDAIVASMRRRAERMRDLSAALSLARSDAERDRHDAE
jgi:hypothetical protein